VNEQTGWKSAKRRNTIQTLSRTVQAQILENKFPVWKTRPSTIVSLATAMDTPGNPATPSPGNANANMTPLAKIAILAQKDFSATQMAEQKATVLSVLVPREASVPRSTPNQPVNSLQMAFLSDVQIAQVEALEQDAKNVRTISMEIH
jgi:hypothetical protein